MSRAQRRTSSKSGAFYEKDENVQREAALENNHDLEKLMDRPKSTKNKKFVLTVVFVAFSFVVGGAVVRSLFSSSSSSSSSSPSTMSGSFLSSSAQYSNIEKFQKDQEELLNKVLEGSPGANHITTPSASQRVNVYQGPDVEGENAKWFFQKFFDYLTSSDRERPLNRYINKDTAIIDTLGLVEEEINRLQQTSTQEKEKEGKIQAVNAAEAVVKIVPGSGSGNSANKVESIPSSKAKLASSSSSSSSTSGDGDDSSVSDSQKMVNAQSDLKEILSVSPLTIILNDDPLSSSDEAKKMEKQVLSIIAGVRITPQPTMVNLIRHPHYKQIIEYLKTYQTHVKDSNSPETSDEKKPEEAKEVSIEEVPAMFIGGEPVANYGEIIEMYNKKELTSFLKKAGKGLISVE